MNNCDVIKDLIPLYVDEVCSYPSRKAVEEHVQECSICKAELERMKRSVTLEADKNIEPIRKINKKIKKSKWIIGFIVGFVAYFVAATCYTIFDTYKEMDYNKYNLSESLDVETDEYGNLYLVKTKNALNGVVDTIWRKNDGTYELWNNGRTIKQESNGCGIIIEQLRWFDFSKYQKQPFVQTEEKVYLFNVNDNENINEVFYYDENTGAEYTLWTK